MHDALENQTRAGPAAGCRLQRAHARIVWDTQAVTSLQQHLVARTWRYPLVHDALSRLHGRGVELVEVIEASMQSDIAEEPELPYNRCRQPEHVLVPHKVVAQQGIGAAGNHPRLRCLEELGLAQLPPSFAEEQSALGHVVHIDHHLIRAVVCQIAPLFLCCARKLEAGEGKACPSLDICSGEVFVSRPCRQLQSFLLLLHELAECEHWQATSQLFEVDEVLSLRCRPVRVDGPPDRVRRKHQCAAGFQGNQAGHLPANPLVVESGTVLFHEEVLVVIVLGARKRWG
mmetsp:Transcript_83721/g.194750  ORF Transcript_83721/g.194750 Transcript_83721/m.194750 type:complete len:287 (-) Transcript_83721:224-1084(-)